MKAAGKKIDVLQLETNVGKAGLLQRRNEFEEFLDHMTLLATLMQIFATPLDEVNRFYEKFFL